jgi:catechol 2,3-dioxygenase-like lactoylglutathione lyase family enzyme
MRGLTILFAGLSIVASSVSAQVPVPHLPAVQSAENPLGMAIHHVAMGVASIERERTFYRDVLGFQVGPFNKRPNYDHQQMLIPGFRIDMIEYKGSIRPAPTMGIEKQGWLHVALTIPNAAAVYERLRGAGVPVATGRMDGDRIGSIFVTDPEGNRLELTE